MDNSPGHKHAALIKVGIFLWGATLAVLFLRFHTADLRQMPALGGEFLSSVFRPPRFDFTALFSTLAGVACAGLIFLAWHGLGSLLLKAFPAGDEEPSLLWAKRGAFGAGAWSLLWYAGGLLNFYRAPTAVAAVVIGVAFFALTRREKNIRPADRQPFTARAASALLVLISLLAFVAALAPPTAKDTLLYHFALPKIYANAGGIIDEPYNIAQFLPLGAEMHSVWAMLLGRMINIRAGEAAAGAIQFAFFPLLLAAVYGWAWRQTRQRSWALTAALMIASVPTVYYVAANAYVDHALALYITLATCEAARWWPIGGRSPLVHLALAFGFALCIKPTAVFLFFPLVLLFLFKADALKKVGALDAAPLRKFILAAVSVFIFATVLAGPWYLRTWARTGSPIFPFNLNVWPGSAPGWDAERADMFQIINSAYGGRQKSELDYLLTPIKLSLSARLEQPALYDGVLGVSFLFGAPFLIWALWKTKARDEIIVAAAFCAALFICWLFTSQQLRYLLPALPSLAVAVTTSAFRFAPADDKKNLVQLSFISLITATTTLVIGAWFLYLNPLPVVLGAETRRDFLTRRLDYYPYYEHVNTQLPPTARVWLVNMRRDTYHIERPYFSDYMFEDYTIKKIIHESETADDARRRARDLGFTHLLVRHDVLLDFARSPIVDDRLPPARNQEKMTILRSILIDGPGVIEADAKFALVNLSPP
ncbi:MAG TPA: hypothetical protein VM870_11630 [Pyrinomonadaceae bacterium]|nr:hypothetical protein [Pyrinomonadaceae bacterium]